MASRNSVSLPCDDANVALSDMPTSTPKTALKFRFKFNPTPNRPSVANAKVGVADESHAEINPSSSSQKSPKISDDPFVADKINGTQPSRVSDPSHSHKKSPKKSSIVKEGDAAAEIKTCKGESSLDQPAVIKVSEAAKKNEKKRQIFSVTLPREEIEEDVAAIEALSGGKRLRRPRKRDLPRSQADQRRLDRLFPGLEYLGFH